jgi:malonyl-CoA/methylmalonyl-CoA synthetase
MSGWCAWVLDRHTLGEQVVGNFFAELERAFESNAGQTALMLDDRDDWTYRDLVYHINRAACELRTFGVQPGDRVFVQVQKSAENLALYLACLKLGLVYVPLNTAYTETELDYFVSDAEPALYVGDQARTDVACAQLRTANARQLLVFGPGDAREKVPQSTETQPRESSDLAAILYTSGTTGRSKGAMLSHGNLSSNARSLSDEWGWQGSDVLLNALPIFHVHGLFIASHCALLNGTPMIFMEKFEPSQVMARLPDATVMMGVPTFYTRLLDRQDLSAVLLR